MDSQNYCQEVETISDEPARPFRPANNSQTEDHQVIENSSYTHTEVKVPAPAPAAPEIHVLPNIAQDLIGEGHTISSATITSTSQEAVIPEAGYLSEETRKADQKKAKELARIEAKAQEKREKETEKYRKEAEATAEKIRKELEAQHAKDIELKKNLVQNTIQTQKKQIDVEEKFAKKELDREQKIAENALDQSKLSTVAEVNLNASGGRSVNTGGTIVSENTTVTAEESSGPPKTLGQKITSWLLG